MGVIHGSPNGFDICDLTNVIFWAFDLENIC